jgi:hypothetical protein
MSELMTLNDDQQYELMKKQAGAFFKSGLFKDLASYEQGVAKVLIGKEMGVGPFASIKGIYIAQNGMPELRACLMAGIICNHPRFAYKVKTSTSEICEIDFYDSNFGKYPDNPVGTASFTIQEAKHAGLLDKDPKYNPWVKYPTDMLYNRALSRGARKYCPGAFGGIPVYVSGEIKDSISEESDIREYDGAPVKTLELKGGEHMKNKRQEAISDEAIIDEILETHVLSEGGL